MRFESAAGTAGQLLDLLRTEGPMTRGELARRTGLSRGTLGQRLGVLVEDGLVTEVTGESGRGRPPGLLSVAPGGGAVLAVDLDRMAARVAVVDLAGVAVAEDELALDLRDGPAPVLRRVRRFARTLCDGASVEEVLGVGVGVPGPFDVASGQLVAPAGLPRWGGVPVAAMVEDTFGVPAVVENDVRVAAIGESQALAGAKEMVVVKLGVGIGCAVVSGGVVQRGARGAAGEIGHVALAGAEGMCRCGNRGCLETVAAGWALIDRLNAEGKGVQRLADVVNAVVSGEPAALVAIRDAGRAVGEVAAVVVNVVNPAVLILAGPLAATGEALAAGVREAVYQRVTPLASEDLDIRVSTLGAAAGVLGAARLVLDEVLSADAVDRRLATTRRSA